METSNSDAVNSNSGTTVEHLLRFLQSPISSLLEYSGILRDQSQNPSYLEPSIQGNNNTNNNNNSDSSNDGEVSIRIVGVDGVNGSGSGRGLGVEEESTVGVVDRVVGDSDGEGTSASPSSSSYRRYDVQLLARWAEQILPFSLLLFVVFIREHFRGFFVATYITAILFKSNDILRKQTALKGERKISILLGYSIILIVQIFGVYWWHRNDDLFNPLVMIPPKQIPPFWHAIFIILVNDTMVRQGAMVLKLVLLMYYKNGKGHTFRRQGQMLTLVEYTLLLYRAFLPTSVWYRFFLNKEYGSLFSALITGLYLTFKVTSSVEKVRFFFSALRAFSRKEDHYGSHATLEQVHEAGDLCAICQEKMRSPILLSCKHIFCEDCVSEWFDRERTCPLCRALVRPTDLKSYADGSTSLLFQLC